jgi:hypothetical protein
VYVQILNVNMKTKFYQTILLISLVFTYGHICAQNNTTTDFYNQIKNYDLSTIFNPDSILIEDRENNSEKIQRAEILGFIGNNYERFQIHFVSIIQNPSNPYEYYVYGKTKVKETICTFQGLIKVLKSELYTESDLPTYKQGFVVSDVVLYEDKKQKHSGFFSGTLTSQFIIDNKGPIRYDALMFVADGFSNNGFIGNWTSYKTNEKKTCNWGDYRIPDCDDLDEGVGEFSVNEKYEKNGWENYKMTWGSYPETNEVRLAREKEKQEWWK